MIGSPQPWLSSNSELCNTTLILFFFVNHKMNSKVFFFCLIIFFFLIDWKWLIDLLNNIPCNIEIHFTVSLPRGAFSTLGESLYRVDLSENELTSMDDGAFSSLKNLLYLNVSHNHLTRFNSDVFKGNCLLLTVQIFFISQKM